MALDLSAVATQIMGNLGEFGYVKLVRKARSYDPITGVQSSVDTVVDLYGVDLPVPAELVDDTKVLRTDKYFIIDGSTRPTATDLMKVGNKDYRIIEITPTNHAGVPQIYEVIARG